jgi:hypothetical protein
MKKTNKMKNIAKIKRKIIACLIKEMGKELKHKMRQM